MKYRMSPNAAVRTGKHSEAVEFCTTVFGFLNRSNNSALAELEANPLNLNVIEGDECSGPVIELFVDDILEKPSEEWVAKGCQVLRWRGKGQEDYIRDPFGAVFNIWEEKNNLITSSYSRLYR